MQLFEIARRFHMQIQPQLILLQKTLLNIEGLGRQLYPDLDIWKAASLIPRDWMRRQIGLRSVVRSLRKQWPEIVDAARVLPGLLAHSVQRAQNGSVSVAGGVQRISRGSRPRCVRPAGGAMR